MVKQTVVVLSDNSTVVLDETMLCKISAVLCYEDQYFTWVLVVVGWLIACIIAYWQFTKVKEAGKEDRHNEAVKDFKDKAGSLESESLEFWLKPTNQGEDLLYFNMAQRELKELTTIARDLETLSGIEYPGTSFKTLRKELTNDKALIQKPLPTNHSKIQAITKEFATLRNMYSRIN